MSESSAHAIGVAKALGLLDQGQVTLLHAFFPFAKGQMTMAGLERESVDAYVMAERQKALDELSAFTAASGIAGPGLSFRVEEGAAFEEIARAVERTKPDLLVIGTHGRSGLMKVLLGSVTEDVLRNLEVDVVVVPPAGRDLPPAAGGSRVV
jgi:universal stress protein E